MTPGRRNLLAVEKYDYYKFFMTTMPFCIPLDFLRVLNIDSDSLVTVSPSTLSFIVDQMIVNL